MKHKPFRKGAGHLLPSLLEESGQAVIEFALTMILLLSLIFFFMQISLVFGWGNYVHYATFMSARAYLSGGSTEDDQRARAKNVIAVTLKKGVGREGSDRFPAIAKAMGGGDLNGLSIGGGQGFNPGDRNLSWAQGVRYTFRSRLFMIPLGGAVPSRNSSQSANSLTLTAESWLGREPAYDECVNYMNGKGIIDNGC